MVAVAARATSAVHGSTTKCCPGGVSSAAKSATTRAAKTIANRSTASLLCDRVVNNQDDATPLPPASRVLADEALHRPGIRLHDFDPLGQAFEALETSGPRRVLAERLDD